MLKLRTLMVTAFAVRCGHSSGTFGHGRGYIWSDESWNSLLQ